MFVGYCCDVLWQVVVVVLECDLFVVVLIDEVEQFVFGVLLEVDDIFVDYYIIGFMLNCYLVVLLWLVLCVQWLLLVVELCDCFDGWFVCVCGFVIVWQMLGIVKGVMFMMFEDEMGCVNVIVWFELFVWQCCEIFDLWLFVVFGVWQVVSDVWYFVVQYFEDLMLLFGGLCMLSWEFY